MDLMIFKSQDPCSFLPHHAKLLPSPLKTHLFLQESYAVRTNPVTYAPTSLPSGITTGSSRNAPGRIYRRSPRFVHLHFLIFSDRFRLALPVLIRLFRFSSTFPLRPLRFHVNVNRDENIRIPRFR